MTDLSPTTQPILDAFNQFHELTNRRLKIAAVLEALADQVVPREAMDRNHVSSLYQQRMDTRAHILAIAAELRGTTTTENTNG